VVVSELWRGASSAAERKVLNALQKNHPILLPTGANWVESGQVLARLWLTKGFSPAKLRSLHVDVLIALTASSHGARLITTNRADFELIAAYCRFRLEVWF